MINLKFNIKTIGILGSLLILISCNNAPKDQNIKTSNYVTSKTLEKALNFLIVSDWGWNGKYDQQKVADQMGKTADSIHAKFVVSCGDNFQINGVTSTQDPLWKENFENIYTANSLQIDWYPVLGNHDYKGSAQAEIDYSKISMRWKMPSNYYTFSKKVNDSLSVRCIFLDTPPFIEAYHQDPPKYPEIEQQDTAKQIKWLKDVLQNATEQCILVFGHHPLYSASPKHGSTPELIAKLEPIFEKYNVDYYICGHDHDFQDIKPSGKKTEYIVTGTGGKPRPASSDENTIFSTSEAGFTIASLKGTQIQILFVDTKGNCMYQTKKELVKSKSSVTL